MGLTDWKGNTRTYIIIFSTSDEIRKKSIEEKLRTYYKWAIITENAWAIVVDQSLTATILRDELAKILNDDSDRLMVILSGRVAAWKNSKCRAEWLKENL